MVEVQTIDFLDSKKHSSYFGMVCGARLKVR